MNTNNTTIVVDAMGGDNSPYKVLKGIEIFNKTHSNTNILLFWRSKYY
jgi:Fatty acid/phospholipid biosynthesis enzyme